MPIEQVQSPRKPRLAFVAYAIAPNDARYLKLRRTVERAGYEVAAFAPCREGFLHHPGVYSISPTLIAPKMGLPKKVREALTARALVHAASRAIAAFHPDWIYVFDPEALPIATAAKERTGARLVYDAHEFHEEEDPAHPERGAWVKRTELKAAPHLDAFVTVNASIASEYVRWREGFPAPVVVHNAVERVRSGNDDGRLRKAAGLSDQVKILLYHGNIVPLRGLQKLVATAPLLSREWRIVLLGSGPLQTQIMSAAGSEKVTFLPPVANDELADWIAGANLGAILYEDSGSNQHFCSPNKLWEYPASGVPVIASDLPEIRKVVLRGKTGELIPAQCDPVDIANVVASLSDAHLRELSSNARRFHSKMNWENESEPLLQLLGAPSQARV